MNKFTTILIQKKRFVHFYIINGLVVLTSVYLFFLLYEKWSEIGNFSLFKSLFSLKMVLISFSLAFFNWYLRILKWQLIIKTIRKIDFKTAAFQQLSAFSWSFLTPFNSGEFIHKPLFVQEKKKGVHAVGMEQITQLYITVFFGIPSLMILFDFNNFFIASVVLLLLIPFLIKKWFYLLILSLARYFIFSFFMFYMILSVTPAGYSDLLVLIPVYFFAVSIFPLIPWIDLPVRSGLAYWIFSSHIPDAIYISAVILWLWFFNSFLPALTGQIWLISRKEKI